MKDKNTSASNVMIYLKFKIKHESTSSSVRQELDILIGESSCKNLIEGFLFFFLFFLFKQNLFNGKLNEKKMFTLRFR